MATPKKKPSRHRSRRRATRYAQGLILMTTNRVALVKCHQCSELTVSHTVCRACGAYSKNYSAVVAKKTEEGKAKAQTAKKEVKTADTHGAQLTKELRHKDEEKGRLGPSKSTFFRRKSGGSGS